MPQHSKLGFESHLRIALVLLGIIIVSTQAFIPFNPETNNSNSVATPSPQFQETLKIEQLYADALAASNVKDYEQALVLLREVEGLADEGDALDWSIEIKGSIAWVNILTGNIFGAIPLLEEAVSLSTKASNPEYPPWLYRMLGKAYQDLGEYEQALKYYLLAHDQYLVLVSDPKGTGEQSGDIPTYFRQSINDLGMIYGILHDYSRAAEYFAVLRDASQDAGDTLGYATALLNLGFIGHKLGSDLDRVLDRYTEVFDISVELGDIELGASTIYNIAEVYTEIGDYDSAADLLLGLLEFRIEDGDVRSQSLTLNTLGYNEFLRDEYDIAEGYYHQAIDIADEHGFIDIFVTAMANVALLKEAQGEQGLSLDFLRQAIERVEDYKASIYSPSIASQYSSLQLGLYQHTVQLLISIGEVEEAFNLTERYRASILLDALSPMALIRGEIENPALVEKHFVLETRISDLEFGLSTERARSIGEMDIFKINDLEKALAAVQIEYERNLNDLSLYATEASKNKKFGPETYNELATSIHSDETLLSYFFTDSDLVVFILTSEGIDAKFLNLEPQVAFDEIWEFTETYQFKDFTPLDRLATYLIDPIEDLLYTKKLGIIPHLDLHYLPFSTLPVGDGYLGEMYSLFELPSASYLPLLSDESIDRNDVYTTAVFGNPAIDSFALTPLIYSEMEAIDISNVLGVAPYLGEDASEATLRSIAPKLDLLHIASHALWQRDAPLFSRIWLSGGGGQDGQVNVYEVFDLGISDADLIVLSGCETGVGYVNDADQAISLARAFLPLAHSVISSLWNVDDAATAFLFTRFYTYLAEGVEKAEALSLAQRDVRENLQHPAWKDPYFWGAFVLYGDPGKSTLPLQSPQSQEIIIQAGHEPAASDAVLLYEGIGAVLLVLAVLGAVAWRRRGYKSSN